MSDAGELIRATILHTTGDPLRDSRAFVAYEDGGLLVRDGRVVTCAEFAAVRLAHPGAPVTDWRGGFVVPGFVDAHVHFPQVRVIGRLGWSLLEWLERAALPEESRMADLSYAAQTADRFVRALAAHGTTTASVFGAHFAPAVATLFEAAARVGVRVSAGLVVSDRRLRPDLHVSPEAAYRDSVDLIRRFHGQSRQIYSVTPRFALSTSEALLDVCQSLMAQYPTVRCQTHLNEHVEEVSDVARAFPWAADYLAVYERFALAGRRAIMAHSVRTTSAELERLASTGTSVAHCPASNAALGSGIFPWRRHRDAGVRCALGTDVGGGTGFGMLKEGLQAYLMQRVAPEPEVLPPSYLLYLATRAGAEALDLAEVTGDFGPGKDADFVHLRPPEAGVLAAVLDGVTDLAQALAALFTLADQTSVREVRVAGAVVYTPEQR